MNVENIYMLFGKLGGNPAEFMCRPYQDCLYNIAVTHSPRYLIDMELKAKRGKTIFEKMDTTYDEFRLSDSKIDMVRNYYVRESIKSGKHEMPWWVGSKSLTNNEDNPAPSISMFSAKSLEEKMKLIAEMTILFPEVINKDYDNAALWLCTHRYLLCLNLRDQFTAGGQFDVLNGERLEIPLPHILKTLQELMPYIKNSLLYDKYIEIKEFHPEFFFRGNIYEAWMKAVEYEFNKYSYKAKNRKIYFKDLGYNVRDFLEYPERYVLEQTNSK